MKAETARKLYRRFLKSENPKLRKAALQIAQEQGWTELLREGIR